MKITGFNHLAIQVRDLEKARQFYAGVLGFKEQRRHFRLDQTLRSIWMDLPQGGFIALEEIAIPPKAIEPFRSEVGGLFLIAFTVSAKDRGHLEAQLRDKRVIIEHSTEWTLYIRDPEGNRIGLSHFPEASGSSNETSN